MLAALRLVQSQMRYLGVEVGMNSHLPNPPSLVFDRRFGDCKDKALLTVALLSRLGIDANVALVNTSMQKGLAEGLPNPGSFDHVIVRVVVDHKPYWLDPTLSEQRSDLAHLTQPDYGLALVVEPATTRLVPMDTARSRIAKRPCTSCSMRARVSKSLSAIRSPRSTKAAKRIRTGQPASKNLVDLQKGYLNWYANYYPHISVAAPLNVKDDEANNRLTISEHYQIVDIATVSEKDSKHTVAISTVDSIPCSTCPMSGFANRRSHWVSRWRSTRPRKSCFPPSGQSRRKSITSRIQPSRSIRTFTSMACA